MTYLKTENKILRSKLPDRIQLNNQERRRLVKHGKKLGARIKDLISIASYSTFRKWVRAMEDGGAESRLNDVFTDSREAYFFFVTQVDRDLLTLKAFREPLVAFASFWFRLRLTAGKIIFIASLLDTFTSVADLFRRGELELKLVDIVKAFTLATKDTTDQRFKFVLALAQLLAEFLDLGGKLLLLIDKRLGIFDELVISFAKHCDLSLKLFDFVHARKLAN